MVTLVMSTVAGLQIRLGVKTASKCECPAFWSASALAKATPTGPSLEPINRSMCAISLPSPDNASPMYMDMAASPREYRETPHSDNVEDYTSAACECNLNSVA